MSQKVEVDANQAERKLKTEVMLARMVYRIHKSQAGTDEDFAAVLPKEWALLQAHPLSAIEKDREERQIQVDVSRLACSVDKNS